MKNNPIFIIGAGRSGTNILRDTLCKLQPFETWPCDEINYIWRHGNIAHPTDRFTEEQLTPSIQSFILQEFEKIEKKYQATYIVEKTCANSMKVPFLHAIFPGAKFIFIVRNGYDVSSSAKIRWKAPLEMDYILKKAKYIPFQDVPYYGFRYLQNRIKKIFSKEKRLAFWGPIYPGMKEDLKTGSLIEICGKQWKACVELAYHDLQKIADEQVLYIKYEDFVSDPMSEMKKVMNFINVDIEDSLLGKAIGKVSPKSVGNYKKYISEEELSSLSAIVSPVMENIYQKI